MDKDKYSTLLFIMIPSILDYYKKGNEINEDDIYKFYSSKLYKTLEEEDTKLCHFSTSTLANMYEDELKYGDFDYPEVAA